MERPSKRFQYQSSEERTLTTAIRSGMAPLFILLPLALVAPAALASLDSELSFHRGVVAFGDGDYAAARAAFEKVVAADPQDSAAIQYLGLITQEQGDLDAAIAHFERALAIEPDNTDLRLDRAAALLEAGRVEEARAELEQVLAQQPDDARANLFAGIAAYRSGEYPLAIERLDRAKALDPALATHATYYAGLSAAFLGNFAEAEGAFTAVEEQSPQSPLSRSAASLRQQVTPPKADDQRPWTLAFTSGIEWDSNPTFAGERNPLRPPGTSDLGKRKQDFRGVFRLRGSYRLFTKDKYSLTSGYDGYLSLHHNESRVDLQTHVGWLSGTANFDPFRFGLRYDYAYTMIDLTEKFRSLHRITPSATYRQSDWGVAQLFFQWQNEDLLRNPPHPFDRNGNRYSVGINQFLFQLPQPLSYVRFGALGEFRRANSSDFSYDGMEASVGTGADLPFEVQATLLYRFIYRDYRSVNALPADWVPREMRERKDFVHRLTIEFARPIGEHIEASLATSLDFNDSNIGTYDYTRAVIGAYLSYRF
jgi:tetratricopeptide (TPR) repeat protein